MGQAQSGDAIMSWSSRLNEKWRIAAGQPPLPPPGTKAKATVKATMKLRVWRHAEQKWYDMPQAENVTVERK